MIKPLTDLLALDEFRTGALFGFLTALGVALVVAIGRRPRPWAGLAFGAATVLSLADRFTVDGDIVVGLVILAVGAGLATRLGPMVQLAAAVPGAVVFARATELENLDRALPIIVVVTVVGGVLVAGFDQAFGRSGVPPVLLAITTFGVYLTTPDTEHSAILLGVALPIALLGWPRPLASLGVGGSFVVTALVGWNVVLDGQGRHGAVVGGLACLGMLVIEPMVRWASRLAGGARLDRYDRDVLVVTALHVGVVAVCSRVAGLRTDAAEALAISAVAYTAAASLLVWTARRGGRPRSWSPRAGSGR